MDKNLEAVNEKSIIRTVNSLIANNYDAHYIKSKEELLVKIADYLPKNASCTVGGSMTLVETGVLEYLKKADIQYFDRYAQGADVAEVYRKAFTSDVYFSSANAITEDGFIYNMDGNGNRVAALIFGPRKVVIVIGINKIVRNIKEARHHVRECSAPANCVRLNIQNPCAKTGYCMDCKSDTIICVTEVIQRKQREKNRIAVLILPEPYGY